MAGDAAPEPPLCVDLDGTLLRSDIGFESVLALARHRPWALLALPWWLLGGLAHAKRRIAERVRIDPATLPYDPRVVDWLRAEPTSRQRILASASDALLVQAVADHLGLFDAVVASDGRHNVSGRAKAAALVERFGERGFDYAGNAAVDRAVWRHARRAIVVNAPATLVKVAQRDFEVARVIPAPAASPRAWWRALRPHQWLKNLLLFLPLLAAHHWNDTAALGATALAWVAFSLCASGTYVVNDLLDLDADRRHPRKRERPFASGALQLWQGMLAAPLLVGTAFALSAWRLPPVFALALATYAVLTLAYSTGIKRVPMLDVIALAALYTLRLLAGAAATGVPVSFWLLSFSMFLFLGLAMLKRYAELHDLRERRGDAVAGRGYSVDDLPLVRTLGTASGLVSVLVLALYIDSTAGEALYRHPDRLWLLCPMLLYWVARAWLVAQRGDMHDDPVVFAARDPVSWLLAALAAGVAWMAL